MEINRLNLRKRAVSMVPLFHRLPEKERNEVQELTHLKEFKRGESIIRAEDETKEIMFVVDGSVDVKRTSSDGKEVIVTRLTVGEFFGEIAFLTQSLRSADVVAVDDCMVLALDSAAFDKLLSSNQGFTRALLIDLAHRVAAASSRISDLALLDVYQRLLRVLESLSEADKQSNQRKVHPVPTQRELAAMVGTSREMISRALGRLEDDGLVEIRNKAIYLR